MNNKNRHPEKNIHRDKNKKPNNSNKNRATNKTNRRDSDILRSQNIQSSKSFDTRSIQKIDQKLKPASEQQRRIKRKRRKKKTVETVSVSVVSIVLFIFCFYVSLSVYNGVNSKNIPVISLTTGSVTIPKEYKSLIIRDETVYKANSDGELVYNVVDGEKVSKNGVVSYISDADSLQYVEEARKNLNNQELEVKTLIDNYSGDKDYIRNLNQNIKNKIDSRNYETFSDFYALINYVDHTIQHRNNLLLASSEAFDEREYKENLSKARNPIYVTNSGVVSYDLDGFENRFTFENMEDIKKADLNLKAESKTYFKVMEGDEVLKVVEDNRWYVISYIDNDSLDVNDIYEGKSTDIYLHNGYKFDKYKAVVHNIVRDKKESKVTFEVFEGLNNLLDKRTTKLKIENNVHTGIKIPLSAIKYKDKINIKNEFIYSEGDDEHSKKMVYLSTPKGEIKEFIINVHKEYATEGYSEVLCSTTILDTGDILVKKDDHTKEYQIPKRGHIKGVLVVNTGVAVFREVYTDETVGTNTGVAILKLEDNPNIREYDKIIEDVTMAEEGDIIY